MEMKKQWLGILAALVLLSSCSPYSQTETGLEYRFIKGKELKELYGPGHYCLLNYMLIGPGNDTIQNTFSSDTLAEFPYPVEGGNELLEALQISSPGSIIEVRVKTDSLKAKILGNPRIMALPDDDYAYFVVAVDQVLDGPDYEAYRNQKFFARLMAENAMIDRYCEAHNQEGNFDLDSFQHMRFRIFDAQGKQVSDPNRFLNAPVQKAATAVSFHAEVRTLEGQLIISSAMEGRRYKAIRHEHFYELPALNEWPFYLNEGERVELVITSEWGYGADGRMGVPSYAPLYLILSDVRAE
ncbi:MAG: hypothetical protein ACO3GK_03515 [Bacteroidia bacterium]